jgi:hypothetical protein
MKKFIWLLTILLVLAFSGVVTAEEDFPPPRHNVGVIGNARNNNAWRLGIFTSLRLNGITYTLPAADGANTQVLQTDGSGTLTWVANGGSTNYSDLGDPTADTTISFADNEVNIHQHNDTNEDMFTIEGLGAFGDVSIFKVEQKTGNATDGNVAEFISGDTDVDALLVTANSVDVILVNGDGTLTLTGNTDLTGNLSVTGTWNVDALAAATATQTLTLDGNSTGGVTIGGTSTGNVTLGDTVVVSDTFDMTIGEGSLTIDNDQAGETALTITSDATTAGGGIAITSAVTTTNGKGISVVADAVTTGDLIYLESSAAGMTTGNFINAYNGAATVFEVGLYGATTIAGNASTDIITVTAGDIQISAGDIDLDNGQLLVDSAQDLANNITRNFAGAGTGAVLTVSDDHASSTNIALAINQDGTGASTGVSIVHDGDNPAIAITAGAARTGNVIDIAMANMVAQNGLLIDGAWTGAADIGMINLNPSGNIAAGASALRIDTDTGTPGASGFGIEIDDDSVDGGTFYALLVNSANNEGLHVEAGLSLFAEIATFTLGIDSDAGLDVDLAANTETVNVTMAANDYAAGAGTITVYDDSTGQTNASYLLRLAREANGDAQDGFILLEDNSTGAAGNGDDMLAINADGDIVMGGASGTGGRMIYSYEDLTVSSAGTAASVEVVVSVITTNGDADEDAVTLADGTKGQIKIFVSAVEGAGGDSYKVTPANMNGGTKITFDGVVGDGCTFLFDGTSWNIISNNGGTIS